MDSKERSYPRHWRVEDMLGHLNDSVDKNNAEERLHYILTSTDILTWNLQGEIVIDIFYTLDSASANYSTIQKLKP